MKNIFSSPPKEDLQNILHRDLQNINKNVLHTSYQLDALHKKMNRLINDLNLQKQVDDYYETSPQTDSEEQDA